MLPEVSETDAAGQVAAIYDRIRRVQGTPVVNFIWRHLATIDEALAWAWPVAESFSTRIADALEGAVGAIDQCIARHSLGFRASGRPVVLQPPALDIVRAYERGNSWNFLAMTLLTAARRGMTLPVGGEPVRTIAPVAANVPKYPNFASLPQVSQSCIDRLSESGPAAASGVRPSLWVHLALWPDVLQQVTAACTLKLASEAFGAAHADLQGQAAGLLGLSGVGVGPAPAAPDPLDTAIQRFRQRIPEMLLIGRLLARES